MTTSPVPHATRTHTEALPPDPNAEAYEATRAQAEALTATQLRAYNLDAARAYAATLCTAERCEFLRPVLAAMPTFDMAHLDGLARMGRALSYAHARVCNEPDTDDGLADLLMEAIPLRMRMQSVADNMVSFDMADAGVVQAFRELSGYRGTITALSAMVQLLHSKWPEVAGRTLLSAAQVNRAAELRDQMAAVLGARERAVSEQDLWIERRRRVATLLIEAHEEVREAVRYLRRREGDADALAPTLVIVAPHSKPATEKATEKTTEKAPDATATATPQPVAAPSVTTPQSIAAAPAPVFRSLVPEEPSDRPFARRPTPASETVASAQDHRGKR